MSINESLKINIIVDKKTGALKSAKTDMDTFKKSVRNTQKDIDSLSSSIKRFGSYAHLYIGSAIVGEVAQSFKKLITNFSEFEDRLLGVSKTTGITGDRLKYLENSLIKISQELKGVSAKSLLEIAQIGGQLGISNIKNLEQFSKSLAKLSVIEPSYNIEQASSDFARFSNVMGDNIRDIERTISVFNELSNTTTATISDISYYATFFSGSAKSFGLVSSEVAALSATLKDLGVRAESGGSSLKRVFSSI